MRNRLENIGEQFEAPAMALSGWAHMDISGNREAVVEGCKGILEYGDGVICLSLEGMTVRFCGDNLCIRSLKPEQAVITGTFVTISFV